MLVSPLKIGDWTACLNSSVKILPKFYKFRLFHQQWNEKSFFSTLFQICRINTPKTADTNFTNSKKG